MSKFSKDTVNRDRLTAVERVREGWIRHLIDLSRRNNLLYYRELKTGTLDFSDANKKRFPDLFPTSDNIDNAVTAPNTWSS